MPRDASGKHHMNPQQARAVPMPAKPAAAPAAAPLGDGMSDAPMDGGEPILTIFKNPDGSFRTESPDGDVQEHADSQQLSDYVESCCGGDMGESGEPTEMPHDVAADMY